MDLTTASALLRFFRDSAALMLWGGSLYLAGFAPQALRCELSPGWERLRRCAVPTLAAAVLVLLPVQAASLGRGWPDAFDPELLRALLFQTSLGTAWLGQATATVLMIGAAVLPARCRQWVTATAAGLLLASLVLTGHAAMREGWPGMVQRGTDILHLIAGGFWLGALVPLLPTLRAVSRPELHGDAILALRRFSTLGHGAVAAVIVTGLGNGAFVFGGWPADWSSPYRRLLVAKVVLVVAMVLLALANRYLAVPRLARRATEALADIRRATLAEIACGLGAVALVAVFGLLEPG